MSAAARSGAVRAQLRCRHDHGFDVSILPGHWAVQMRTPVGTVNAEMSFREDRGGLTGQASAHRETVELQDIVSRIQDNTEYVSWRQAITKPLRLNLEFEVTVTGDQMRGHSRAGRLPRSTVTGRRIDAPPGS